VVDLVAGGSPLRIDRDGALLGVSATDDASVPLPVGRQVVRLGFPRVVLSARRLVLLARRAELRPQQLREPRGIAHIGTSASVHYNPSAGRMMLFDEVVASS
jgi:hypothetical protein